MQDEALTSHHAEEELEARGKPYERGDIDALAATYIVQDWLDGHPEGERVMARRPVPMRIIWILLVVVAMAVVGAIFVRHKYHSYIQPVSDSQASQIFTVKQDSSVKQIADNLQDAHLIRSSWAFQLYVQRKDQATQLQAGTYALSPSEAHPKSSAH